MSFHCFAKAPVTETQNPTIIPTQASKTTTYTFKELGWDKSITLNGYKPSYTLYLPINNHLNPQKAVIHLKLASSSLLTDETNIDITFNQTIIRRVTIPVDSTQEVSVDIELPLTQLSPEWQTLTFEAHLSSKKNLCNPDNWIYISPDSSLTLTTLELPFNGTLNQLPVLFLRSIGLNPIPLMLLLPEHPESQEIFSLFRIALQIGKMVGDNHINLMVDFINGSEEKQKESNLIAIGTKAQLFNDNNVPLSMTTFTQDIKTALNDSAGVMILEPSPFNPIHGLLIITGSNYSALSKSVSVFLTPEFTKLASGKDVIVDTIQVHETEKPNDGWYHASLEALGYSDQSVSGLGRHMLSYMIPLPNDHIPSNVTVKTLITAPLFTLNDHSQITLLMNGSKQSSFKLVKEHSSWNVQIDSSAMKPGVNKLEYLVDLHLENENCTRKDYNEVWATIYAQTEFNTLFLTDVPQAMLNQFPVPFGSAVTVIVPDQLSKMDINNLAQLMLKFGQLIQPNPIVFNFLTSTEANEDFVRHNNIILYGNATNNAWINFAADYFPVQLKQNARFLKSSEKQIQLSGEYSSGLLELIASPWSERHHVLLITGENEAALSQAVLTFVNDKSRIALNGNIALINSDGSVELLKSDDNRYFSLKNRIVNYIATLGKNSLYYIENHLQLLIYLLACLVPLYVFLRQRKK